MLKRFFTLTMICLVAVCANAQITTSSLEGTVTAGDEEVIGAHVQVVHQPSGTRYNAVTNAKGHYSIQGMRVGGPYSVEISYLGFETKKADGIHLQLGVPFKYNAELSEDAQQLTEVVVSASGSRFAGEKTGASTAISNEDINYMPTVTRNITDFTRLSPYGGNGMVFAGSDGRTANFTVDGANFNNNFGLSDKLPGGGSPISIESIEEMQVVISPYDVRETNFIGGGVNAITKSGTNQFKGSAYVYHRNENMRGDAIEREQISGARDKDQYTQYGFTLGGPIVKNKLFFFVNGEMSKVPTIVNRWKPSEDGVADADNFISRTTVEDLERVRQFVQNKYGYDPGSYTDYPADEDNYKILARVDWNINDDHHLAVRYNYTKNRMWNTPSSTSMDGGTRSAYSRASQYAIPFSNSLYAIDNIVHTFSFDLNSRLANNLYNQLLVTYSKLDDVRATDSGEFPFVEILDGTGSIGNYMSLGYELFSWNNAVHNDIWTVKDDVTYYLGNHKIMAGLNYEHQMADNMYMRNGTGYYRYNSVDDFINGAVPDVVALTYGYGGESKPAARVQYNKVGFYAQDDWNVLDNLKVNFGLRLEGLFFDNGDLMTNNAILGLDYYDRDGNKRNIDTGKWPNNNIIISPRVGFNWDVFGDRRLKVRGGTGLFAGRLPLVFFTNMPTNGGMVQYQAALNAKNADMSQFAGGLVTDANGKASIAALQKKLFDMGYPSTITPEQGALPSSISAVDPDFKLPQAWKTSLAVDYTLPVSFPLTITAEGIFTKTINAATLSDWSVPEVGGFARFNGADNRPIYPDGYHTGLSAFMLENTSRGYGFQASLSVTAKPLPWLNLMAAYTHTMSKELTGMPGSNAESAFTYVPTVEGPNNIQLHNSQYVTPDRYIVSAGIHDKHCNHFTLILEGWRGGYLYSYMMANDMNGDGYNYDALYIPTDREVENGMFRFVSEDDKTRFMDYVHADDYLSNHQGEYAEAYSLYSPWVHKLDFDYKHDFKVRVGNYTHALQLSFDMKNVLNFFNSSWGVSKYLNPAIGSDARILKYEGADKDGYARFSTPASIDKNTETFVRNHSIGQCWNASIGIKYFFTGDKNEPGCGCKDAAPTFDNSALNDMIAKNRALEAENARLAAANKELSNRPAKVEKVVETKNVIVSDKAVVTFAQNSSELSAESKAILDQIKSGSSITVVGATSPEGTSARNSDLSIARANVVADYLRTRGVNVLSAEGNDAGRVAIVTIK